MYVTLCVLHMCGDIKKNLNIPKCTININVDIWENLLTESNSLVAYTYYMIWDVN